VHDVGLDVFDMRSIDETSVRQAMQAALASVDKDTHVHVSFDVDLIESLFGKNTLVRKDPHSTTTQKRQLQAV
jgi:arginase